MRRFSRFAGLVLLLASFRASADHVSYTGARAAALTGDAEIAEIFRVRCVRCHKKKGLFDKETNLPTADFKKEILRRIELAASDTEHMPPEDTTQLTPAEKVKVVEWMKK